MYRPCLVLLLSLATCAIAACGSSGGGGEPLPVSNGLGPAPFDPGQTYSPNVSAADLSTTIDNALFPAPIGATWVYEGMTDEGFERIEVTVESADKPVWGTTAVVIRDTVYLDGEMIEDTWDWFAQDRVGHVWYLGEETYEYENGTIVCDCGAWEAGVDGALPGVNMLASPKVGDVYRSEFYAGEAEDLAEVISVGEAVSVEAGSWSGCLKTRDRSAIELDADEFKYYCPGVGNVLIEEGPYRIELVSFSMP